MDVPSEGHSIPCHIHMTLKFSVEAEWAQYAQDVANTHYPIVILLANCFASYSVVFPLKALVEDYSRQDLVLVRLY